MIKRLLFIILFCPISLFGQDFTTKISHIYDDIISSYKPLSLQQLVDTADYYFKKKNYETALICYNLLINATPKNADFEQQKKLAEAYNRLASIYFLISDFRMAYDLTIKRLVICEKYNLVTDLPITYANIGVVYAELNQYEMAKQYYLKAKELYKDSAEIVLLLNNLGHNEIKRGKMDSAYFTLNKAIQISKRHDNIYLSYMLNTLATYYQIKKQYKSAFYYLRLSLEHSKKDNDIIVETVNLSDLGKLYLEINKIDSAQYYINLSNKIATENNFLKNLTDNYLTLSEIEKAKGRFKNALNYYVTYTNLKDSIYNAGVFGSVNLIQRQYEVSKTDQQIEELVIDKQLKENTIRYQRIIGYISFGVLLLITFVLVIIFFQKRKLNKAYQILFEKNIEIVELQNNPSETNQRKSRKRALSDQEQNELFNKILHVMDDPEIFCDTEFSIDKLTELVHSNQKYVSEAINNTLNKNFRSFLNSYRIREAQRLFANRENAKFTIESVAPLVGFKSPKTFWDTFKEMTGVTPNYYLKSMQEQQVS
jgi:AraC-like DNA-binding protein